MRRFFLVTLTLAANLMTVGCAVNPTPGPDAAWIRRHGGICATSAARRGEAALNRLVRSPAADGFSLTALNSSSPSAYAWPDGSIFITRGLAEMLDDDALTAAIAHELGHLDAFQSRRSARNLGGSHHPAAKDLDIESHADAAGIALLRRSGVPAQAMRRMLSAVRNSPALSASQAARLDRRMNRLPSD